MAGTGGGGISPEEKEELFKKIGNLDEIVSKLREQMESMRQQLEQAMNARKSGANIKSQKSKRHSQSDAGSRSAHRGAVSLGSKKSSE